MLTVAFDETFLHVRKVFVQLYSFTFYY